MTATTDVDLKYLHHLLVDVMKVKRRPVAVTYCADGPPPGYESADVVACAIVREAEAGRRVYVDQQRVEGLQIDGGLGGQLRLRFRHSSLAAHR